MKGATGKVELVILEEIVLVSFTDTSGAPSSMELEIKKVKLAFYPGDSVVVLCGVFAGRIGMIQTVDENVANITTDGVEGEEVRHNSALRVSCLRCDNRYVSRPSF